MGNEQSQLKGLVINKKAIEVTDYWSLYYGEIPNNGQASHISIFQGETLVSGQFWANQNPLERATRNLKIYRHPGILKYIASWSRGSLKMLATERCRPLSTCLNQLTDVQICLGLRNILGSLIFLIEQANVRHINIGISSVYVTDDGTWKLFGFEHLWTKTEFNKTLLDNSRTYRYNNSIDPSEGQGDGLGLEQFSFGVMCEEILRNKAESNIPAVDDFKTYCMSHLKHPKPDLRPKLSAVMLHPILNHDFILIHSFLTELPLKGPGSKQDFFTGLIDRLRQFDETAVASQMSNLLLSRIVLLDTTAQLCVTPFVLRPRTDDISNGLFSANVFISHIVPKLKQVFSVRDAQIRLILLEYFSQYIEFFTVDELKEDILPQLLLGIKDTNDLLVSKTLLCLADLVPILGSAVVIGGKRGHIFADGRPQGIPDTASQWIDARSITPVLGASSLISASPTPPDNVDVSPSNSMAAHQIRFMTERLSPEGEDLKTNSDVEIEVDEWSDWDNDLNEQHTMNHFINSPIDHPLEIKNDTEQTIIPQNTKPNDRVRKISKEVVDENIDSLDIKTQSFKKIESKDDEEIDFFKDMEPVIQKTNVLVINDDLENNDEKEFRIDDPRATSVKIDSSRFEIKPNENETNEDGWGDETSDDW